MAYVNSTNLIGVCVPSTPIMANSWKWIHAMITGSVINMKIFKIDSCSKCPSLSALTNIVGTYNVCHLEMRKIGNNLGIIQTWCPLEEEKEAEDES